MAGAEDTTRKRTSLGRPPLIPREVQSEICANIDFIEIPSHVGLTDLTS